MISVYLHVYLLALSYVPNRVCVSEVYNSVRVWTTARVSPVDAPCVCKCLHCLVFVRKLLRK